MIVANNTVLLVVDMQKGVVAGGPFQEEQVVDNIARLLGACRQTGVPAVFVRHDDGADSDLRPGLPAWEIIEELAPLPGEYIVDKRCNSDFVGTGLRDYLDGMDTRRILLVGMQTELCIDATCKAGFEHGYDVIVPADANTTFANEYLPAEKLHSLFNHGLWAGRFARSTTTQQILDNLSC